MSRKPYKFCDAVDLYEVPVPENTNSYKAVSNATLITALKAGINSLGMNITGEEYKMSGNGQIITGRIFLGNVEDGLQRCIGTINSYNKTKAVGIACGANVFICANGMFTSELVTLRKHTPNVLNDLQDMISRGLNYLENSFTNAKETKNYFQLVKLNKMAINEIIGQLYIEAELIKDRQLSIIKDGMKNDKNFNMKADPTLWNMYNLITESFKKSNSTTYVKDHITLHKYMYDKCEEWELGGIPQRVSIIQKSDQPFSTMDLPVVEVEEPMKPISTLAPINFLELVPVIEEEIF